MFPDLKLFPPSSNTAITISFGIAMFMLLGLLAVFGIHAGLRA